MNFVLFVKKWLKIVFSSSQSYKNVFKKQNVFLNLF